MNLIAAAVVFSMLEFKEFRFADAPTGMIQAKFLATPLGKPRALLIYLHGHGERAEKNTENGTALRGNRCLIPNVLERAGDTAAYVDENFVVVVPQAFLDRGDWETARLWECIKGFYGSHVGGELSGELFITGVSMGGRGTWSLAGEVIRDDNSPFQLQAIAAVDVYAHIHPSLKLAERVRAMGLRTPHIHHDATESALKAVGQADNFINRTLPPDEGGKPAHFSRAWKGLYGRADFYAWLLKPNAPLPEVPWDE